MTHSSTHLLLPYLQPAQAQKHVTVNESLAQLDLVVQLAVESRSVASEPATPSDSVRYILPPGKTGVAWDAMGDHTLGVYQDGVWRQINPRDGWLAYVRDEALVVVFGGGSWSPLEASVGDGTAVSVDSVTATTLATSDLATFNSARVLTDADVEGALYIQTADRLRVRYATSGSGGADVAAVVPGGSNGYALFEGATNAWTVFCERSNGTNEGFAWIGGGGDYPSDSTYDTLYMRLMSDGSLIVGDPAGGAKGPGAVNAVSLYDDNTLLSCYVFDQALDGVMDERKWDAQAAIGRAPHAETIDAPGQATGPEHRQHTPMRRFRDRLGGDHDPLTLDGYARHWREKRHLTSMPNEARYDPVDGALSTGEWIQRLVETVEIQAVLIEQLNARTKHLTAPTA